MAKASLHCTAMQCLGLGTRFALQLATTAMNCNGQHLSLQFKTVSPHRFSTIPPPPYRSWGSDTSYALKSFY